MQTSEGLRPVKIIFSQDEREQMENVARVSVKGGTEKFSAAPPQTLTTRRRRKSSKNDSGNEELKQSVKGKDEDSGGIVEAGKKSSKRGVKSPDKSLDKRKSSVLGVASGNTPAAVSSQASSGYGSQPLSTSNTESSPTIANEQKKPSLFNISSYVSDLGNTSPEKSFAESSSSQSLSPSPNKSTVSNSK